MQGYGNNPEADARAFVVLRPEARGSVDEAGFLIWCRGRMAAYKAPRHVAFVDVLPKSGTGKILWRELQDQERTRPATATFQETS